MAKHKRWVLLNSVADKTLIRNFIAYRLANKLASVGSQEWHPSGQLVEVVINGLHRGNYLLCEQIKIADGARIKGVEYDDEVHTPAVTNEISYLLEGDRNWGHNETGDPTETLYWESYRYNTTWQNSSTSNFSYMYGTNYGKSTSTKYSDGSKWYKFRWGLKSPDDGDLGSSSTGKATAAYKFINGKVTEVEQFMFNTNFTNKSLNEIREKIDLDSFIEYWLVYEITLNQEPNNPGSCYMHYYNGDGKLYMGPVWDFDYGTYLTSSQFNDDNLYTDKDKRFLIANSLWYCRLLQNPNVQEYIKTNWSKYRAQAESIINEFSAIENYLTKSAEYNYGKDNKNGLWNMEGTDPNSEKSMLFSAAVARIKTNMNNRLDQLETLINNKSYK